MERILEFFNRTGYYRERTRSWWEWIYSSWTGRDPIIRYATVESEIVAHYAVLPSIFSVNGRDRAGGMAIHLAAAPEGATFQPVIQVCRETYEASRKEGIDLLLGFPSEDSWELSLRLLGWTALADLPSLEAPLLDLQEAVANPSRYQFEIQPVDALTRDHAELIQAFIPPSTIRQRRSMEFLDWRYAQRPDEEYVLLSVREAGRLRACAILKTYTGERGQFGHVLEWGLPADSSDLVSNVLHGAVGHFRQEDVDIVSTWMLATHPAYPQLRKLGLSAGPFVTHSAIRPLEWSGDSNLEHWHLAMGDYDVF